MPIGIRACVDNETIVRDIKHNSFADLAHASVTSRAIFVCRGPIQNAVRITVADVVLQVAVEAIKWRYLIALEVRRIGTYPRC